MTTQYQKHLLANRARRVPRRVQQLQTELKSHDRRVAEIEDSKDITAESKAVMIKQIRQAYGPVFAQVRRLVDRGAELGLRIAA